MTDLLSSPRPAVDGGEPEHRPDWGWLPDPDDVPDDAALARAREDAERLLADHGVTYGADRPEGAGPWRLDPVPVMVDETEWAGLEAALVQRAELLDAVLADVYGARRLLTDSLLPPTAVVAHPGFLRALDGLRLPGGRELVLTATDLVRDPAGGWRAVADRTQAPSGAGYAMEGRRVVAQVLAGVYRQASIQRLGPFFHAMRAALREVAPPHAEQPRIVLLTSGPASETAFDQAYLASMLGLPLVEGPDLLVREGRVWLRALDGLEPVDVVLRRVDAEWCDPLDLRTGSRLGVPGLVRSLRGGAVSVVNPLGASVLENPALLAYLPRLARTVLDQDLALPSAPTWWCGEPTGLQHVLSRLGELVVLPTVRRSTPGLIQGWTLDAAGREALAARIAAEPWAWAAQEPAHRPGSADDETDRAAMLRTYAVAHRGSYAVMAGGLARVAASAVVSSSSGAVAKDVWVLSSQPDPLVPDDDALDAGAGGARLGAAISPRTAENLWWMGRYAERAEDRARLLRVVVDRWDDFHHRPRSAGGRALAVLVQAVEPDDERTGATLRELVLDPRTPTSVTSVLRRLGSSAATVRDQLSTDTFGPLARIDRVLRAERSRRRPAPDEALDLGSYDDPRSATAGLRSVLDQTLEGLLAVAGIAAEGLVRDVGWKFLDAGRRVERAQHVVEHLRATLVERRPTPVEAALVDAVVLSHDSSITFRRRYASGAGVAEALDLLLRDRTNPRALAFQLDRVRENLGTVPAAEHLLADVADLVAELDPAAVSSAEGRRERLAEALDSMAWRLRSAAEEIERVHFARPGPSRALEDPWDAADEGERP
ncbi:circularly permuted type 2 ATP-grasp protein [Cellulomonas edaphi]|uniref:Circularly permuted type 2 ATP-grasp protein n=1 Tax=Cellulomonas edaphi TaxID=3053468 RepID=A0ABT7S2Y5_9CELL|nr:circularly permuted type 2 ATP-grasp protein [Cellulomons edaphi]MDM7829980.1 circularly permuted type 2 ATP-grasp protein [Cellulomons edaphi]